MLLFGWYDRRRWEMTDAMMARTMPCSTPTSTTVSAVASATTNSSGRSRRILRIPGMSTSSTPIRNTTEASTAFGMYWSGLVRNSRTMMVMAPVATWASSAAATGAVDHLGLGGAAVHGERAREAGGHAGQAETDEVGVLAERLVVLRRVGARCGRALGQDEHEDGEGGGHQLADLGQRDALGEAEIGEATRHRAEGGHTVSREIGCLADHHRADDRDQRAGNLRGELLAAEDDRDHRQRDAQRRHAGVGDVFDGAPQLLEAATLRSWGHR